MNRCLAYHYTIGDRISSILGDGVIKTATQYLPPHVKPAVWLTTSETFEPTARKRIANLSGTPTKAEFSALACANLPLASIETCLALGLGVYRIAVDATRFPLTWSDYCKRSGDSRRMCRELQRSAEEQGSDVSQWRVSFDPIPEAQWLRIERFDGNAWLTDWAAEVAA